MDAQISIWNECGYKDPAKHWKDSILSPLISTKIEHKAENILFLDQSVLFIAFSSLFICICRTDTATGIKSLV